jgi:hypothetical protein
MVEKPAKSKDKQSSSEKICRHLHINTTCWLPQQPARFTTKEWNWKQASSQNRPQ